MHKDKQDLTRVEQEVLSELGERLGVRFVVGKGPTTQKRVVLSNKRLKVKITDPELKKRLLDKKAVSYQSKYIRCGKKGCFKCPHGPYIYAFWRAGGNVRSKYLGRLGV